MVTGEPKFRGSTMRMILLYHLDEYEMPSANVSTETCLGCHPMEAQHFANATCTACHTLHVARRAISMIEDCATCHAEPTAMVGAHVGVTCGGCHVRHEYTPNCVKCHRPHGVRYITNADCFSCHGDDPHHMVGIAPYPDVSKEACADCHVREYDVLKKYNEAHNTFVGEHRDALRTFTYDFASSCVDCHPQHPPAISCTAFGCHFNHPHRTMGCVGCHFEYLDVRCGTCHVDPHAPMASLEWTDWRRI